MVWAAVVVGVLLVGLLLYWQLILAEGAYLGRGVVALLYDWSAHAYDRIKQFDPGYEQWFLARPLTNALFSFPDPVILDVATGTARLARTLMKEPSFRGRIVGLDLARKMLQHAVQTTRPWADRLTFVWQGAAELPFPDDTFEAVTCLEALEFMPDPEAVLREMVRVLRPGGLLLTTNRIGKDARWLPGRTYSSEEFEALLQSLELEMVRTRIWQVDYDLVWALKPGVCTSRGGRQVEALLRCPLCGSPVTHDGDAYRCRADHIIPIADDGIVEMVRVEAGAENAAPSSRPEDGA